MAHACNKDKNKPGSVEQRSPTNQGWGKMLPRSNPVPLHPSATSSDTAPFQQQGQEAPCKYLPHVTHKEMRGKENGTQLPDPNRRLPACPLVPYPEVPAAWLCWEVAPEFWS